MLDIQISEEPLTTLAEIARIPIAFEVQSILDVTVADGDVGRFALVERSLDCPYVKDYDALEGEGPTFWARRFDISNWGLITSRLDGRCVGGAVIALNTPGIAMFEGRSDLAILWDIRVVPELRGQGIGSSLFQAAEAWAATKGCRELKIETQNINVAACEFYARQGCILGAVNRVAYRVAPDEIQLLWHKNVSDARRVAATARDVGSSL